MNDCLLKPIALGLYFLALCQDDSLLFDADKPTQYLDEGIKKSQVYKDLGKPDVIYTLNDYSEILKNDEYELWVYYPKVTEIDASSTRLYFNRRGELLYLYTDALFL